jgi:hypothetical protein
MKALHLFGRGAAATFGRHQIGEAEMTIRCFVFIIVVTAATLFATGRPSRAFAENGGPTARNSF